MKVFGLVVARSGSKGLANKNVLKIKGKTLIEIVCSEIVKSNVFDKIIISTDSDEYGVIAEKCGVRYPWKRPSKIASDISSINDVINHAIKKENMISQSFTHIALFQPSSPLIDCEDIEKAYKMIKYEDFDSIISGYKIDSKELSYCFYKEKNYCKFLLSYNESFINRQNLNTFFRRCGNLYFFNIKNFLKTKQLIGQKCGFIEISEQRSICVDDMNDFIKLKKTMKEIS